MQDGAPVHRSLAVLGILPEVFNNCVMALQHGIKWPPQSLNLSMWLYMIYMKFWVFYHTTALHEKCPYSEFFWSVLLLDLLLEQCKNVLTSDTEKANNKGRYTYDVHEKFSRPPTPLSIYVKNVPPPWLWTSNFKRAPPQPSPTNYGITVARYMWKSEIKTKT